MTDRNIRVRRVSGRQLDILWEYLNSHRDIAAAYNRSLQAKEYSSRKWREIAETLNSQGEGAHKDWRGWSKYWVDYKAKLKKRAAAVRASHLRTGGGPSTEQPLSEIETKFIQILGEDFGQGLPGIQVAPFAEPSGSTASVVGAQDSPASESILVIEPSLDEGCAQDAPIQQALPQHPEQPSHPSPSRTPPLLSQPAPAAPVYTPRRRRRTPSSSQPAPAAVTHSPRHRRHLRREPPMTQEAARRALVQSSQMRAEAAVTSSRALQTIGQGIADMQITLQRIERIINAAFPRAAE